MATLRPSLRIEASPGLLKLLRSNARAERRLVGKAINVAIAAWGHPHLHAGAGIRKLQHNLYECRSGLKSRLVFEPRPNGRLYFHTLGSHDEVQRFLKAYR